MGLCLYMSRDSHMKHKILIDFIYIWSVGTNSFPTKFCSSIYNALLCKSSTPNIDIIYGQSIFTFFNKMSLLIFLELNFSTSFNGC